MYYTVIWSLTTIYAYVITIMVIVLIYCRYWLSSKNKNIDIINYKTCGGLVIEIFIINNFEKKKQLHFRRNIVCRRADRTQSPGCIMIIM